MFVRSLVLCIASILAGCVIIDDEDTISAFGPPPSRFDTVSTEAIDNSFGIVSLVTAVDGNEAGAFASLLTTFAGSPLPTTDIVYTGNYEIIGIENIDTVLSLIGPDFIRGNTFSDNGTITLVADVSNNTLTGDNGTLVVFSAISGSDLDGAVTYDGQAGELEGRIYAEGGIAAFHGNDDDRVFAGGLTFDD